MNKKKQEKRKWQVSTQNKFFIEILNKILADTPALNAHDGIF